MRDAALDDVSDHLGTVLRHADELLAEWSRFGGQVRAQVDREVSSIGDVVDGAVTRAASAGIERGIAERLRALTSELDRLEQRARAASRVVGEQRAADRRLSWVAIAGVVIANALLVALLLRPAPTVVMPAPEPVRVEAAPQVAPAAAVVAPAPEPEPSHQSTAEHSVTGGVTGATAGDVPGEPPATGPAAGSAAPTLAKPQPLGAKLGAPRPHRKLP